MSNKKDKKAKVKKVEIVQENATNALIMNDKLLTGKKISSKNYNDWQVYDAKMDVDDNHK